LLPDRPSGEFAEQAGAHTEMIDVYRSLGFSRAK
jgi:hypothetical protein